MINTMEVVTVYDSNLNTSTNILSASITQSLAKIVLLGSVFFSQPVLAELPIYAAYVSEQVQQQCKSSQCTLGPLDGEKLTALAAQLSDADLLAESLALSDYEVLIGNALVNINENNTAELVLEITTSWRQIPIDDIELKAHINIDDIDASAQIMMQKWTKHLELNQVLEADRIYQRLEASNYKKGLNVPAYIGEFVLQGSAVYRDPLLGSITRYVHPEFIDAVVDISVYPFSPLTNGSAGSPSYLQTDYLQTEMNNELRQIRQLITQANIQDFSISDIQAAEVHINGKVIQGLRIEVLLNIDSDPVYSTQYVFKQNDKIIKLSGNLPQFMMSVLVSESLPKIKVPAESTFMKSLRQG